MIEAQNLLKKFGSFCAISDISFQVKPGEILGFLGPNGAGKSTTMKILSGFLYPTAGTARIGGFDVLEKPVEAKRLLGYLPENAPLYEEMTVMEFLVFASELRSLKGKKAKEAIDRAINLCHLEEVIYNSIDTLSKGYRRRTGMAQAILHDPPFLIMDEPTDGLDPNQKQEVRKLIAQMAKDKAVVLSTHILEEVKAMCSRIIIIDHGKIIADNNTTEILKLDPTHNALELQFNNAKDQEEICNKIKSLPYIKHIELAENKVTIFPKDKAIIKDKLLHQFKDQNWALKDIRDIPESLETVFHNMTSSKKA